MNTREDRFWREAQCEWGLDPSEDEVTAVETNPLPPMRPEHGEEWQRLFRELEVAGTPL